jgi:uncharacterized BrkB/YihY/UPF0761 family membrane protein
MMFPLLPKGDRVTGQAKLARGQKGLWREIGKRMLPSLRYISSTEVHAYAFSIAANAYLCFFPFTLLLLTVCRRWLGWESASRVILELLQIHLPKGADSILRNISQLAAGRPRLQLISVFVLFFTSSGVFLPLEVALNKVWSVPQNRSFLKNQVISLFLAVTTGLMALLSILLSAAAQWVLIHSLGWILAPGLVGAISRVLMETLSVPLAQVLPAALVGGVLTEVGKLVYMLTLPLFRFREVYGPYETSATLLFWAYGAAMMLLFGAHLSAHGVFIPLGGESAASASATIDDLET